jgi:hypothetical protein
MPSCCNLAKVSLVPIWHLPPSLACSLERHLFAFEVLVLQLGASPNEKSVTRDDVLTRKCRPRQSLDGPLFLGASLNGPFLTGHILGGERKKGVQWTSSS